MKRSSLTLALVLGTALWAQAAHSFCGFYVAAGDAQLFNRSSKVVLVRDGDRTVLTMANDFRGDPRAFAIVVPVPTLLEKGQIHVGDPALLDHLDAYSAPRLVEYFDESPCNFASDERPVNGLREMATGVGVTERAVVAILNQLEDEGIVIRQRQGRRNSYLIDFRALHSFPRWSTGDWPLPEPLVDMAVNGLKVLAQRTNGGMSVAS